MQNVDDIEKENIPTTTQVAPPEQEEETFEPTRLQSIATIISCVSSSPYSNYSNSSD